MRNYKEIVATLKKEGAREVKGLVIKGVKFHTGDDDVTKMCLTLDGEVPAFVSNDDGATFTEGVANNVWVFPSVIKALLREIDDYAPIRDYLVSDESIAKMALIGSKIDVLAVNVSADELYKNPFSSSDEDGKPIGHDTVIHHVVNLVPSKNMAKVATKLEDKILEKALAII